MGHNLFERVLQSVAAADGDRLRSGSLCRTLGLPASTPAMLAENVTKLSKV